MEKISKVELRLFFSYNSDFSQITRGRVLNGELYTQRLQKLIYLHPVD